MTSLIRRSLFLLGCLLAASCTTDTPSYSIALTAPDAVSLGPGESSPVEMTLTRLSAESGEVRLTIYSAPEGVTLEPTELVLPQGEESITLTPTLAVAANTTVRGLNEVVLVAEDAGNTRFATAYSLYVVVLEPPEPQPDFGITVDPRQITLFVGQNTLLRVALTRSQGFTGPVTLSLESPTTRISAQPATIGADQTTAELEILTDRSTTAIPVPLKVIATSEDGRQAKASFTLNLRR
jgi:hypothetical protein